MYKSLSPENWLRCHYVKMFQINKTHSNIESLKPCLHRCCDHFATKINGNRRGCKGRGKVFLKSAISRRLKSVTSCLLNIHKRWVVNDLDYEEVAEVTIWSQTSCQWISNQSATTVLQGFISDQSTQTQTSRRPIADGFQSHTISSKTVKNRRPLQQKVSCLNF